MTANSKHDAISVAERVRWVSLGLGSESDIKDISSAKISKHQSILRRKLERSIRQQEQTSSGIGSNRLYRYSAATLAVAGLLVIMIVSVNSAIASQRIKVSNDYAFGMMSLALDLYEEDLEVLVEKAVISDRLLPAPGFLTTDPTSSRHMNACAQAIHGLKMVRMGFPELGVQKLAIAQDVLDSDLTESNSASLDFVFNLIAGKSSLEALETMAARGAWSQDIIRNAEEWRSTSGQALARVSDIIGNEFVGLPSEEQALLQAAIKTDLGRLQLKTTPISTPQFGREFIRTKLDSVQIVFDEAKSNLDQTNPDDPRWLIHRSRLLNNQILLDTRFIRNEMPSSAEFKLQLSQLESETQRMAGLTAERLSKSEHHYSAANFEVAICYSNLADLVQVFLLIDQTPLGDPIRQRELELRQSATSILRSIPEVNRTERLKENLVLNEFLTLLAHLRKSTNNGNQDVVSDQMVSDAKTLKWFVGDVMNPGIGQISPSSKIAVALILQDSYSIKEVARYLESKKESIFPADMEFLRSLVKLRTSKPPV